ncbi:MAG: class I SAM-dependent methyltransferase [Sideroxyarcus sp.]|nr:class I SAM-dependent methyltransferase [Sideroxyarcus sp.]
MNKKQNCSIEDAAEQSKVVSARRVSPEYRDVVGATAELLREYRAHIHSRTPKNPAEPFEGQILEFSQNLWQDWRAIWSGAADCLLEITSDSDNLKLAKQYTEALLTRELLDGPIWWQAYTKPRGYPGDYLVMDHIYNGSPRGETPFGQVVHTLGIQIGQFVEKRKEFVRQAITEMVAQCENPDGMLIASLGCGPAKEIVEFSQSHLTGTRPLTFVLVDQDSDALRHAGHSISETLRERQDGPPIDIQLRHQSVMRLMREVNPSEMMLQPDMIYSAGLFDYFGDRTCRVLSRRLYDALRPGGLLLLGNMKANTDMVLPLELVADWSLTYRTSENVLSWADGLEGAEISLRTDATGYDYLLSVRKPA